MGNLLFLLTLPKFGRGNTGGLTGGIGLLTDGGVDFDESGLDDI